jgi:hypothetical protein
MLDAAEPADPGRLVLFGSFISSSSYKPMLFLALSGLPFDFRMVNLKHGVQRSARPAMRRTLPSGAGANCPGTGGAGGRRMVSGRWTDVELRLRPLELTQVAGLVAPTLSTGVPRMHPEQSESKNRRTECPR